MTTFKSERVTNPTIRPSLYMEKLKKPFIYIGYLTDNFKRLHPDIIAFDWREPFEGYESKDNLIVVMSRLHRESVFTDFLMKIKAPNITVYNFVFDAEADLYERCKANYKRAKALQRLSDKTLQNRLYDLMWSHHPLSIEEENTLNELQREQDARNQLPHSTESE